MFDIQLTHIRHIPIDALKPLITSLLAQLPEKNSPVVIAVKPEIPVSGPFNGQRQMAKGVLYDPTVVYILELVTVLTLRDEKTVQEVGQPVAEALQSVIRDAVNIHPTAVSRAIYYLFSLLEASHVRYPYSHGLLLRLISARNILICECLSFCTPFQA